MNAQKRAVFAGIGRTSDKPAQRYESFLCHQQSSHAPPRPRSLPRPLHGRHASKGFWEPA